MNESWIQQARVVLMCSHLDLFRPRAARYWADFLLSVVLAYGLGAVYLGAPLGSWQQAVAFPLTAFWLYRLGSLVHEVAHLPQHELRFFKVAWNLLVGTITLTPSPFFTWHHRDHHSLRLYGTPQDPEYIVNVVRPGSWLGGLLFVLQVALFPLVVFLRFLATPLTFLHPRLREWVLAHASSLTMNWRYERRRMSPSERRTLTTMDWLCWARASLIPFSLWMGWTEWSRIPLLYTLAVTVLALNQLRLLADHHFASDGRRMELTDHILDSCNFTGRDPLTWLFFPFAIRYHALHHLFPSLPYHNLAAAHARLLRDLPVDSPYRGLDQATWWSVASRTLAGRG